MRLMTCETNSVNRLRILSTWTWLVAWLILSLVLAACNNGDAATTVEQPVSQTESPTINEDIPVEALPDPLPAPYLFTDEVTIEDAPVTETIYVIQPGDTLAAIAARFCITIEEIQRLNTIVDVAQISIGDELRIPIREGGCGAAAPPSTQNANQPEPERLPGEIYIVEAGDTLADIAASFGFTWVEIMNYNGLTEAQATALQIGQALIIPPPPEETPAPAQQAEPEEPSEPPG